MTDRVLRHDDGGLCTLTLNRPEKLNALDTALFAELDAHLAQLEGETERIGVVVLRGAGKAFCAGADLEAFRQGVVMPRPMYKPQIIDRLAALPQPVVAAVHGACLTGGLELALAADFIVAAASARFADTHGQWGFIGSWGLSQRLPRRIGMASAKRMILTGCTVAADEALRLGLIDECVDDAQLDAAVVQWTAALLRNSWFANRESKRLLRETDGLPLAQGLAHVSHRHPGPAPDSAQRVAAFKASRREPGKPDAAP